MNKPKRFRCPACGGYIRGRVRETRIEEDGVTRCRICEDCGIIVDTLETITGYHEAIRRKRA